MALNRQLQFTSTLAVSVAMMAPSLAISLNPQVMAGEVGAAVPVAYIIAAVTVPLLGWCFAVLARRDEGRAGSVYRYIGTTLGPRWGTFTGITLAFTYTAGVAIGSTGVALLGSVFLQRKDWTPPSLLMAAIAVLAVLGAAVVALSHPPFLTKIMLTLELVTVALILVATLYMLFVLLTTGGPQGQRPTTATFALSGIPLTALALAAVIGFTSFAGFEGAASSAGESLNPRRHIPIAITGTAVFAGVFYVGVSLVTVWAYGTTPADLLLFQQSDSVVGDVADQYLGIWMGDLITIGGMASAFGTAMAGIYAASRVFYAIADDGILPRRLAGLDRKHVPRFAVFTVAAMAAFLAVVWTLTVGINDAFAAISTFGGLMFLTIYLFVPLAAGRALWGRSIGSKLKAVVVPTVVFVIVGYVLFQSAWPLPTGYLVLVPYLVLVVLLAAAVCAVNRRRQPASA